MSTWHERKRAAAAALWCFAALATLGTLVMPPLPAYAQSEWCNEYGSGRQCGEQSTCTAWTFNGFDASVGQASIGVGIGWECSQMTTLYFFEVTGADGSLPCFYCHDGEPVATSDDPNLFP